MSRENFTILIHIDIELSICRNPYRRILNILLRTDRRANSVRVHEKRWRADRGRAKHRRRRREPKWRRASHPPALPFWSWRRTSFLCSRARSSACAKRASSATPTRTRTSTSATMNAARKSQKWRHSRCSLSPRAQSPPHRHPHRPFQYITKKVRTSTVLTTYFLSKSFFRFQLHGKKGANEKRSDRIQVKSWNSLFFRIHLRMSLIYPTIFPNMFILTWFKTRKN